MVDDRIFLFSGTKDTVISPLTVDALQDYYGYFANPINIATNYDWPAQNCMPTLDYGEVCGLLSSPFIGNCALDAAGLALKQIYGQNLVPGTAVAGNLKTFDQTNYFSGSSTSLGTTGYIYVPTKCALLEPW